MALDDSRDSGWREVDQVQNEEVRVLRLDPERLKHIGGEVPQVVGHDDLGVTADRCCQHVAVVGIGQREPADQWFVAGDQAIGDGLAHQLARSLQLLRSEVWATAKDAAHHLVEYLVAPAGPEQASLGEADQQIPKPGGV